MKPEISSEPDRERSVPAPPVWYIGACPPPAMSRRLLDRLPSGVCTVHYSIAVGSDVEATTVEEIMVADVPGLSPETLTIAFQINLRRTMCPTRWSVPFLPHQYMKAGAA